MLLTEEGQVGLLLVREALHGAQSQPGYLLRRTVGNVNPFLKGRSLAQWPTRSEAVERNVRANARGRAGVSSFAEFSPQLHAIVAPSVPPLLQVG
jgi:hypothetical protein